MSAKIKLLLALFAFGLIAAVPYARSLIRSNATAQLTAQSGQSLIEQIKDTDGDGLIDQDETYWRTDPENKDSDGDGFIDGEEVLSGHHPLVAGPNDWIDKSKNLTQRTVNLTIGGVLAGDIRPGSTSYEDSIKTVTAAMAEEFQKNITITLDTIIQASEDTAITREAYLDAMSNAMLKDIIPAGKDTEKFLESIEDVSLSNPIQIIEDPQRLSTFTTQVRRLSGTMGERAARVAAIPVPRSFSSQHQSAIRLLRMFQKYYQLSADIKADPMQGILVLKEIITLHYEVFPQFLYDFNEAMHTKSR